MSQHLIILPLCNNVNQANQGPNCHPSGQQYQQGVTGILTEPSFTVCAMTNVQEDLFVGETKIIEIGWVKKTIQYQ